MSSAPQPQVAKYLPRTTWSAPPPVHRDPLSWGQRQPKLASKWKCKLTGPLTCSGSAAQQSWVLSTGDFCKHTALFIPGVGPSHPAWCCSPKFLMQSSTLTSRSTVATNAVCVRGVCGCSLALYNDHIPAEHLLLRDAQQVRGGQWLSISQTPHESGQS